MICPESILTRCGALWIAILSDISSSESEQRAGPPGFSLRRALVRRRISPTSSARRSSRLGDAGGRRTPKRRTGSATQPTPSSTPDVASDRELRAMVRSQGLFGGARLLVSDSTVAYLLLNGARGRVVQRMFGVPKNKSALVTIVALAALAMRWLLEFRSSAS